MSADPSTMATSAAPGGKREAAARDEMIGSLGEALAGVNLGPGGVGSNGFSFHSEHESGTPFPLASPPAANGDVGWGFAAEASRNSFARSSNGREETRTPEPNTPQRKQSIDLFLSQSPSQALGRDVFKLSSTNLHGLAMTEEERASDTTSGSFTGFRGQPLAPGPGTINASPGNFGEIRQKQEPRRKSESPSCSVTGTTTSSRSVSPYPTANDVDASRRAAIQAYHGFESGGAPGGDALNKRQPGFEEDRSGHGGFGMTSLESSSNAPRIQSPYNRENNMGNQNRPVGFPSPYDQGNDRSPQPSKPMQQQPVTANPQQQVLYMAVPTADGRGQVLQPVQMVQLPGKPFAYVVPGSGGIAKTTQGGMGEGHQPVMVLQSMPHGGSNELQTGMIGVNSRVDNRNKAMGYQHPMENGKPFNEISPIAGLRNDDFNAMPQNGIGGGNQYMANMNQPDALASLYATPQRPPLDALLGQVRRLSRDQVGCRLVQQALDEEGPMAATLILNEGLPFWGEAMVDPFGNYLFQKILEKITSEERIMLVRSVSTRLVNASLNLHGTRSVQKVVELCAMDEVNGTNRDSTEESAAEVLTKALTPAAARLCIDSHGNHVIQRILLKLGHLHSKFVFDAVAESVGDVARHRHGCCVIQRCLDSPPSTARSHLVHRIVDKSLELMQDAYGNYVVQYVLDVCSDDDVHAVCESVAGKVNLLAIQKFSSNVMEKCLERCTDRVKEAYMAELSDVERVRELMMDPFGNYVIQRALSVATHAQAVRLVEAMRPHLLLASQPGTPNGPRNGGVRNTAGGRRIMAKICRRFPNFTLNPTGSREELYSQSKGHNRHQHSSPTMSPFGQLSPQHHQPHQLYGASPHALNLSMRPSQFELQQQYEPQQFDQREAYYDIGEAGYFQHTPHMGHGAYPTL
jgi:hypothetical protein